MATYSRHSNAQAEYALKEEEEEVAAPCSGVWVEVCYVYYLSHVVGGSCLYAVVQMKAYFETYQLFFRDNLPQLSAHFSALHLTPDIYIIDWSVPVSIFPLIGQYLFLFLL